MREFGIHSYDPTALDDPPLEGVYFLFKWWYDGELLKLSKSSQQPTRIGKPSLNRGRKLAYRPRSQRFRQPGAKQRVGCLCGWRGRRQAVGESFGQCPKCGMFAHHISRIRLAEQPFGSDAAA